MKPRVAIDARMVGMGGIGRYTASLVEAMMRQRPEWRWVLVGDPQRLGNLARLGAEIRECRAKIYSLEEAFGAARHFNDADLVHVPHFNAPFGIRPKTVVTVHDLIHFDFPEYQPFPLANAVLDWKIRGLLRRAAGVVTVSAATGDALKRRYPAARLDGKLRVVWEGVEPVFTPERQSDDVERLSRLGLSGDGPVILYVGAIREHKQTQVLVEAFEQLTAQHPELKARLWLAGNLDARFDRKWKLTATIAKSSGRLRHISGAADRDLAAMYRRATAAVLPSRVEGFGLPVVEAMRSGTPIVISDAAALREVAGDAAPWFAMGRVDALRGLLYNVLSDTALRAEWSRKGRERSLRFEWPAAAAQTLEFYETILNGR